MCYSQQFKDCVHNINYWTHGTHSWMDKQINEVQLLAVWHCDSMLVSINKVNLRWAWLVLGWVMVSEFSSQCMWSILVCNQPARSIQCGRDRCNEYQPKGRWHLVAGE